MAKIEFEFFGGKPPFGPHKSRAKKSTQYLYIVQIYSKDSILPKFAFTFACTHFFNQKPKTENSSILLTFFNEICPILWNFITVEIKKKIFWRKKILSTIFSLIYGLSSKGKIGKNQYVQSLVLAISSDENGPITFSKPAQEASPVMTLGNYSKGQVRTRNSLASHQNCFFHF